jgi:hypothetical protein
MPLTEQQRQDGTRAVIEEMFVRTNQTAIFTSAQLKAAFDAVDDWCDANQTSFNNALPTAFKNGATQKQKALMLAYVALKRENVI